MTFMHVLVVLIILSGLYYLRLQRRRRAHVPSRSSLSTGAPSLPLVQTAAGVAVEPLPNPYPPYYGTLRIHDPLQDNTAGYGWMDDSVQHITSTEGCHFCQEAYHLTTNSPPQSSMVYCLALNTNFSNFVYQIEATLLTGAEIGIVFRQTPGYRFYYFYIRRDGSYGLLWSAGAQSRRLADGLSSAIQIEVGQPNVLAVVANGMSIDLYVNQHHLTQVVDATYQAGRIGTAAATDAGIPNEAAFRNVMLWTLD